ncbi:MAG: Ldh family oxidoreductase [Clostridia bacterium]|nr:Ldh family oxidoreductase [Clostridia bacterium]
MQYINLDYRELLTFCESTFRAYGFTEEESRDIAAVVLAADLNGIESHGVQRMVRYAFEVNSGMVDVHAVPEIVHETPISAVIEAHNAMGQVIGQRAMRLAIQKAKTSGCGMVEVRNSNHYGIAGFYTDMAMREDLMGICMTNTEEIMVPVYGKQPMIGTNPIALSMPADPIPFLFDCATTVVPRGKFEVYTKRGDPVPIGWGVDEKGLDSQDAPRILDNIIHKAGGGILPLGGSSEKMGGHKGYGLGVIVELFTGIFSGGTTADRIYRTGSGSGICHTFIAVDYGLFGDKAKIRADFSEYLEKIRNSPKAEGCSRIYTHGEKEVESRARRMAEGIPVNEKTIQELKKIAADIGDKAAPFPRQV